MQADHPFAPGAGAACARCGADADAHLEHGETDEAGVPATITCGGCGESCCDFRQEGGRRVCIACVSARAEQAREELARVQASLADSRRREERVVGLASRLASEPLVVLAKAGACTSTLGYLLEPERLAGDIARLAHDRDTYERQAGTLGREVERLRGAIERHRQDVWGRYPNRKVGHPDDVRLYAALAGVPEGREPPGSPWKAEALEALDKAGLPGCTSIVTAAESIRRLREVTYALHDEAQVLTRYAPEHQTRIEGLLEASGLVGRAVRALESLPNPKPVKTALTSTPAPDLHADCRKRGRSKDQALESAKRAIAAAHICIRENLPNFKGDLDLLDAADRAVRAALSAPQPESKAEGAEPEPACPSEHVICGLGARARCTKPQGHEGEHGDGQGYCWTDAEAAPTETEGGR